MRIDVTLRGLDGAERDVALTTPAGACFGDVEPALRVFARAAPGTCWWAGGLRLHAGAALGTSGLVPGAVISAGPSAPADASAAVTRIAVIGGPDAGRLVTLPRGGLTVGRAPDCDLALSDPDVSRRHVALRAAGGGVRVRDLGSTNGSSIDGRPVGAQEAAMAPGQLLRIGESTLALEDVDQRPATVRAGAAGTVLLSRPPRWSPAAAARLVELPVPPRHGGRQRVQWIAALVPAAAGAALALAMHSLQFLVFLLLSPLVILANALGDRIHWRRSRRREAARHDRRVSAARAEVAAALRDETAERRRGAPDPVALLRIATARGGRLWERRRGDPDALTVRVGLADLPSSAQARTGAQTASAGTVPAVPVCVDLRAGPVGIAAPSAVGRGIARWLVGQLAVLHAPADVELAAILSDSAAPDWAWLRWLPHLRGRVAVGADGHARRLVAEFSELAEQRLRRRGGDGAWDGPWLVLVIEGRGGTARLPALAELLANGMRAGITAICLDRQTEQLPSGCVTTAVASGETGTRLRIRASGRLEGAEPVADRVSHGWADELARSLAPVVDAGAADGALPDECRLVDLLPEVPDAGGLRRSWGAAPPTPATVLGMGEGGPIVVDLARDGPHVLVAGTTGAGKSELLQTLVAGLAAGQPPSAVTFLLIDYKGGAAFGECARLPHVAGVVTDLDGHLTARALSSLECELRRREQLLAAAGASDLDAYRGGAAHREPLPRLVIVVDEFAALGQELPQFVTGLVGVAQRGRSLGVHLVLATQRPGGAVSPEIRANATLRVALRVADPVESLDVIGTDAAARIDRRLPGRAVLSTGGAVKHLQVARVAAPERGSPDASPAVIPLDAWRRSAPTEAASPPGRTDLQAIVAAACAAAAAGGWAPARRPWLPPLPTLLPADALPPPTAVPTAAGTAAAAVHIGLADHPQAQSQPPVLVDLAAGGGLLFTGAARSGRTSALFALAAQAAAALGPHRLEIHAVDCAGGALAALEPLPHCGTVARGEQFDLVAALLRHIDAEFSDRAGNTGDSPVDPRRVLLLLDGWESFCAGAEEYDSGLSVARLLSILRAAASAGATVAIAGDRSTLAPRVTGTIPTRFVLRLADHSDYALAGIPARAVPELMPPGRAVRAADAAEVQLCFLGSEPTVAARVDALAELAARSRDAVPEGRPDIPRPVRMRPLPQYLPLSSIPRRNGRFRVGRGGDTAEPVLVDLFAGAGRLLIAGPPRSGRSTVLRLLLAEAVAAAVAVLVAAPRRSPVAAAAAEHGAQLITPDDHVGGWQPRSATERILLLVDDSELFLDTGAGETLTTLVRRGGAGLAAVAAGRADELPLTYRGVAAEVRRSRCALLLQPAPVDGELVGIRLPRHHARLPPGRGLLVGDPEWGEPCAAGALPIQVALPDTDSPTPWAPDQPMCG